jgi:hypothetical protein
MGLINPQKRQSRQRRKETVKLSGKREEEMEQKWHSLKWDYIHCWFISFYDCVKM